LVVLSCAPTVGRASCGDYVVVRTPPSGEIGPMGQHAAEMSSPLPAKPHKPCHGPNCSRGPSVPPLSSPTVSPPVPPEWGWLTGILPFVPSGEGARFPDSSAPLPFSLASSIFHPPRCLSELA